jgi:bifunctional non-homologous end joining protein LigD
LVVACHLAVVPSLENLSPMLLTSGTTNPIEDDRGWAFEAKWDGFRVLVASSSNSVQVRSRHGTNFTEAFPELAPLPKALGSNNVVLDGELVCFGSDGRTSFAKIRRRWGPGCRVVAKTLAQRYPATLVIFDQLVRDGRSVMDLPYEARRESLAAMNLRTDQHWLVTDYHVGQGLALAVASKVHGLEGLVGKRLTSRYRPGIRSADWRKLKNFQHGEFVVGGWLPASGGGVEALYVGRRLEQGELSFEGTIELGVDWHQWRLREALALLASEESPFDGWSRARRARWVKPLLLAKARYIGYDAGVLREPILEGLAVAPS